MLSRGVLIRSASSLSTILENKAQKHKTPLEAGSNAALGPRNFIDVAVMKFPEISPEVKRNNPFR
jgi:hypothetical protein